VTYRTERTHVAPIVTVQDGELVVKLVFGDTTYVAGVGDGRHFFSQVVAQLVDPALLAHYPRVATYDSLVSAGVIYPEEPDEFAAPND